jgi:hypothetical protein
MVDPFHHPHAAEGELDEMRLVDGIAGAKNIYRRRGEAEDLGGDQQLRKRIKFVMDCSGVLGKIWLKIYVFI